VSERGNVTVMTLGFLAVLGLLVTVVVNASAAYLERRELMSLADQIALHAADGLDRDEVYTTGVRDEATLDAVDARAAVADLVPSDVRLSVRADGDRVHVGLVRELRLPLAPPGFPGVVTVRAQATARLHLLP